MEMTMQGLLLDDRIYLEADAGDWSKRMFKSWDELFEYYRRTGEARLVHVEAAATDLRYLRRLYRREELPRRKQAIYYYNLAAVAHCLAITDYETGEPL